MNARDREEAAVRTHIALFGMGVVRGANTPKDKVGLAFHEQERYWYRSNNSKIRLSDMDAPYLCNSMLLCHRKVKELIEIQSTYKTHGAFDEQIKDLENSICLFIDELNSRTD